MFLSRKTFRKTSKNNWRSRKKQQKKTIKKYGKQLVKCTMTELKRKILLIKMVKNMIFFFRKIELFNEHYKERFKRKEKLIVKIW